MAEKKDSKQVSLSKIDELIKACDISSKEIIYNSKDGDVLIIVEPYISFADMEILVNSVINNAFDEEGGFHPETLDPAEALQIMNYYTNIKISANSNNEVEGTMSDRLMAIMYGTDIIDRIREVISSEQQNSIRNAIHRGIEHRREEILTTARRRLEEIAVQLEKATEAFTQYTALFEGVDPQQLINIFSHVSEMDEAKIAEGVFNAQTAD